MTSALDSGSIIGIWNPEFGIQNPESGIWSTEYRIHNSKKTSAANTWKLHL